MSIVSCGLIRHLEKDLSTFSGSDDVHKDRSSIPLKIKSLKMYKGSPFQFNLGRFHTTVQCPGQISHGILCAFMFIHVQMGSHGEKGRTECDSFLYD